MFAARCANVERNFLNEDQYYLSTNPYACTQEYFPGIKGEYGKGVVVCGSPGKVGNDLTLGGHMSRGAFDFTMQDTDETSPFPDIVDQQYAVWNSIAVWGQDQLWQRMAWALYQLLIVTKHITGNSQTEDWVNYYNIFVRNAFGNYYNIFKEIAFSGYV